MQSHIIYKKDIITPSTSLDILHWLNLMNDFQRGYIYDQEISRTQKWYHTHLLPFSTTWKKHYDRWNPFPYCKYLYTFQHIIQNAVNSICNDIDIQPPSFNSCLINKYENGNKLIKPHSDHQTTFGKKPVVAILSIGDTRRLHFRPISYLQTRNDNEKHFYYDLEQGSLLVMAGDTQQEYCHYIEKEQNKSLRYSLTFREHNIDI